MGKTYIAALALLFMCLSLSAAPEALRQGDSVILTAGDNRVVLNAATAAFEPGQNGGLEGSWYDVTLEDRAGMEPWEYHKEGAVFHFDGVSRGAAKDKTYILPAKAPELALSQTKDTAGADFSFDVMGMTLVMSVSVSAGEPGCQCRITAKNRTGESLADIMDVTLSGMEVPDGWFLYPEILGCRIRPGAFEPGEIKEGPYPGYMYMQWLDFYNKDRGVYMASEDDYGYIKKMFVGRDLKGQPCMGFSFTGCWVAEKDDSFTTPPVRIACHQGDWKKGADIYRPWIRRVIGPLNTPQKILEMPTSLCWLEHEGGYSDLARTFEMIQASPVHAAFITKAVCLSVPEGWDGILGGSLDYKKAFGRIKELGGSAALFTFDRATLMGTANFADYVQDWANKKRSGAWETAFNDMMPAPFSPTFREQRIDEAVRWVRDFGLDELHYDTEGSSADSPTVNTGMAGGPCYRADIGARPNETPHYFKTLYRETVEACRKYNPEFTLRAEHCADFFYPEFASSSAHQYPALFNELRKYKAGRDYYLMPEVFRYTLPEFAQVQIPAVSNSEYWMYMGGMGYGFHGGGPSWQFDPFVRDNYNGSLKNRYDYYDREWRLYYDWRVGFAEASLEGETDPEVYFDAGEGRQYAGWEAPVTAITSKGKGREITCVEAKDTSLMSQQGSGLEYLKELGSGSQKGPFTLDFPVTLSSPTFMLHSLEGSWPVRPAVRDGRGSLELTGPGCYVIEAWEGPHLALGLPGNQVLSGEEFDLTLRFDSSREGSVIVTLPAGWEQPAPVKVAKGTETRTLRIKVPAGIFGKSYPVKAVYTAGRDKCTAAGHISVAEPFSVVFGKDDKEDSGVVRESATNRFRIRIANNTPRRAELEVSVTGGCAKMAPQRIALEGISRAALISPDSAFHRWAAPGEDEDPPLPANCWEAETEFTLTAPAAEPCAVKVTESGKVVFEETVFPDVAVMDLSGSWKMFDIPNHKASNNGLWGHNYLDTWYAQDEAWDGGWEDIETPWDPEEKTKADYTVFRKHVLIPAEWQGEDLYFHADKLGQPWDGGTLNLVYVNGYPCGRLHFRGEVKISPFVKYGAYNTITVFSHCNKCFTGPSLTVRGVRKPERFAEADSSMPEGLFAYLGNGISGNGLTCPDLWGKPGKGGRVFDSKASGEGKYLYLNVADDALYDVNEDWILTMEYLDEGEGTFGASYDSNDRSRTADGAFTDSDLYRKTGAGGWKTAEIPLMGCRFANRQHGKADLRICPLEGTLTIRSVSLKKAE
ncbi:MAG: hypothetical protein IJT95_03665 [Abditibacteriota bacterium]|nr:hypothetical protein [Abditibacteriota bacterium]